jgi:crotonobetainyl-CoA:carnitine CoA-transferase CaiB-like acyl-CoA transferase
MADGALVHNIFALHALEQAGRTTPRGEDLLTGGVPCYGVYPTKDGRWLAVGALEDKFWRTVCTTIGRPDLVAGHLAVGDEGARVRAELDAVFAARTLADWVARFGGVDACVTPVATLDEALRDEQFAARGVVVTGADGAHSYAPPWTISGHGFRVARDAPAQGEHTAEVLREAGIDGAEIEAMFAAGAARR